MAYISYNKIWEREFDNSVSIIDKVQDLNICQLKLKLHDTCKRDERLTTHFEPTDDSDVIKKAYVDDEIKKIDGHFSYIEKDFNEFKLQCNKQSIEQILIPRAVKATIQILYDKGSFDN